MSACSYDHLVESYHVHHLQLCPSDDLEYNVSSEKCKKLIEKIKQRNSLVITIELSVKPSAISVSFDKKRTFGSFDAFDVVTL
jgi:hypothetical protein